MTVLPELTLNVQKLDIIWPLIFHIFLFNAKCHNRQGKDLICIYVYI